MSLESFKNFVREKPGLTSFVRSNEMTWQKFYEMYELYGPSHSVWNKYLGITNNGTSLKDMLGLLKNIDMSELQRGIGSLQKGIGYLQEIVQSKTPDIGSNLRNNEYTPRPIYKQFDD